MVDFPLRIGWESATANFAERMPLFMFDKQVKRKERAGEGLRVL